MVYNAREPVKNAVYYFEVLSIYLSELDVSRISDDRTICPSVASIANQLNVPHPEVFKRKFSLRKDCNGGPVKTEYCGKVKLISLTLRTLSADPNIQKSPARYRFLMVADGRRNIKMKTFYLATFCFFSVMTCVLH